jgi:tRNA-2-methylthio-N6-dimethylallyladenosine synthase
MSQPEPAWLAGEHESLHRSTGVGIAKEPVRSADMLTFHIVTFGCQMNVHDSEGLGGLLRAAGYEPAETEASADIVILNTCAVRERPEQKVETKLGALSARKRAHSLRVAGVCGCVAEEHGERLLERHPQLDFVCGTGRLAEVVGLVEAALSGRRASHTGEQRDGEAILPREHGSRYRAFVDAIYGCTNFCAYCIVPHVRGPERSRPLASIVREVEALAAGGWLEVTLLGQNVNAYGNDLGDGSPRFAELLRAVHAVEGIRRIRFTTSHPADLGDDVLEAMAGLPKVCEHLHLPVQAGDDAILAAMRRRYTRDQYLGLVQRARALMPGLSLTTDVIVGFPGETPAQFDRTLDLFREVRFDQAFSFVFVPRPGTPAASMEDPVPRDEKVRRLEELAGLQKEISRARNEDLLGGSYEVLVDGASDRDPDRLAGRTRTNKLAIFPRHPGVGEGDLVMVRATRAKLWGFEGELAT